LTVADPSIEILTFPAVAAFCMISSKALLSPVMYVADAPLAVEYSTIPPQAAAWLWVCHTPV
jgi:hypothetical protein